MLGASAILVTWFLGSRDGAAIADVLFGRVSPSARLPVSFPHATGQEPYHYDHKSTGRPNPPGPLAEYKAHYREYANEALFPFGHGLTYGAIEYSALELGSARMGAEAPLGVAATIRNTGSRAATEVVQLYVHDVAASITRPVRELRAFQRVTLAPGEAKVVRFTLRRDDLLFVGERMQRVVEPGAFRLWIAPSAQAEGVSGTFTLA